MAELNLPTDYLGDIYNTVIMKDVISRESIRNVRFLTDLVRFVGDNIGKNISANSIRKFMLSQNITISPTLTSNYLSYLCNAYIIDQVRRFDVRGKRVFETNEKYYFEDIGLRNVLVGSNLRMDIEKLLENVVYLHLCSQGYQVTVGQLQNGEVDFAVTSYEGRHRRTVHKSGSRRCFKPAFCLLCKSAGRKSSCVGYR